MKMETKLRYQLHCCCGTNSAGLCFKKLPKVNQSTSTQVMYSVLLFVLYFFSYLFLTYLDEQIENAKKNSNETAIVRNYQIEIPFFGMTNTNGHRVIYTSTFFYILMHFCLFFYCIGVSNSMNKKAWVHNGFWGPKLLYVLICVVLGLKFTFGVFSATVFMYTGMFGGFLFNMIQMVFIVDGSIEWQNKWLSKSQKADNIIKKAFIIGVMAFLNATMNTMAASSLIIFKFFYSEPDNCYENKIIIYVHFVSCVVLWFLSIISYLTGERKTTLMSVSFVSAYMMYLTWSCVSNSPPSRIWNNTTEKFHMNRLFEDVNIELDPVIFCGSKRKTESSFLTSVRKVFLLFLAAFSAVKICSKSKLFGISPTTNKPERTTKKVPTVAPRAPSGAEQEQNQQKQNQQQQQSAKPAEDPNNVGGQIIVYDEAKQVTYSYSFMHFSFILSSLYMMVNFTGWLNPKEVYNPDVKSWFTVKVQVASSLSCCILYVIHLFGIDDDDDSDSSVTD